ncbi:MAG TPA: energy transducer TonB [Rhodopila sp.]
MLRADRAWVVAPRSASSARSGAALATSVAAHVLAAAALSVVVWTAAPDTPPSAAVAMVFEAPASPPAATPSEPEATPPTEAAVAQPPQPEQAEPPPPEQTAAAPPEPVEPPPAVPPEPAPAPPPVVRAEAPPPLPRPKPVPRKVATVARPEPPQAGPAPSPPPQSVASARELAPPTTQSVSPVSAGWNTLFSAWLASRKNYPEAARRRGEEGNVTLRFKVAGDGTVLDVALVTGSGSPILDAAAQALFRDAKVPPPQVEIDRTVRLRYRLDN